MKKLLCLLFILIPSVLALDDFNVYYKSQSIESCDCSQYIHKINIHNADKNDFTIYSEDYPNWIQPFVFSLDKDEIRQIDIPVNIPCTIQGEYNLDIIIKTKTTKVIPLKININRCPNIEVMTVKSQEACPGQQIKYPIEIKNTGNFKETYSFDLDKYKKYALIDFKSIEVEPGKTAKFNLYLNIPLSFEDDHNFTFITKTKYSKLTASTQLFFNVLPCYKYELNYEEEYILCKDTEETIPVNVKNLGNKQSISFDISKYALDKNKLELNKNEEGIININIAPDKIGIDDITLTSKNNVKENEDKINIDVKSKRNCYKAEIKNVPIKLNQQGSFKIKNIGFKEAKYILTIDSDWIKIPDSVAIGPNEEKEINLDIDWSGKEGRYNFNIKAAADKEEFVQSVAVGEFVFHKKIGRFFVNIYAKTKDFVIKNKLYVAIVIGAIILLMIILKVISKISEKKLEKELLEEEKEPEKIEKPKKVKADIKKQSFLESLRNFFKFQREVKAEKVKKEEKPREKKKKEGFKLHWKIIIPLVIAVVIILLFYFIKTLRNYFLSYWLYLIIGIIILFLLILFVNIISKIDLNKQKKGIKWMITSFVIILALLFIYLKLPSFDLSSVKSFFTNIFDYLKDTLMPVYDFLYSYVNYIILGFVILIILIFLMNLFEKKKGKDKKETASKKTSKKKKK